MRVPEPEPIILTSEEQSLCNRIVFDPGIFPAEEVVRESTTAAVELAHMLLERKAIPEIRIRYFTDPALNVGGHGNSRAAIFKRNGSSGDDMLGHPHFLEYLRYFIYGPNLPLETIARFRQVLIDDAGTSGMILDQMTRVARAEARQLLSRQRRTDLPEEFFKLALECGADDGVSLSVRNAVRQVR